MSIVIQSSNYFRRLHCVVSLVTIFLITGCTFERPTANSPAPVTLNELNPSSWVALGKPGPSHRLLDMFVGSWNTVTTMFGGDVDPETGVADVATSTKHKGRAKIAWILGNRFIREEFEGEMAKVPFQGLGLMGYDNGSRRYTNMWIDSLSTAMVHAKGRYFAEDNKFEFIGLVHDPLVSKERNVRTTIEILSPSEYIVSTYEPNPTGQEIKTLEIRYEKAS